MNAIDKIEGIEKAEIYDTNTAAFVMDDGNGFRQLSHQSLAKEQ